MTTTERGTTGLQPAGNGSLTGRTTNALLEAILNRE